MASLLLVRRKGLILPFRPLLIQIGDGKESSSPRTPFSILRWLSPLPNARFHFTSPLLWEKHMKRVSTSSYKKKKSPDMNLFLKDKWKKLDYGNSLSLMRFCPKIFQFIAVVGLMPLTVPVMYMLATLSYSPFLGASMMYYSAITLTFLGGVRWGDNLRDIDDKNVYFSVVAPLISWIALLLPLPFTDFMLYFGYALCTYQDVVVSDFPDGYKGLRLFISTVVVLCLFIQMFIRWLFPSSELRYTYALPGEVKTTSFQSEDSASLPSKGKEDEESRLDLDRVLEDGGQERFFNSPFQTLASDELTHGEGGLPSKNPLGPFIISPAPKPDMVPLVVPFEAGSEALLIGPIKLDVTSNKSYAFSYPPSTNHGSTGRASEDTGSTH